MDKIVYELPGGLSEGLEAILTNVPDKNTFWSNILYAINDPLFIVDENKEIVFFNKKAEEVTGFSAEEVMGKPCITGIRCVNCLVECALFKDGEVRFKNLEFVRKDGSAIKVVKNAAVFTDGNGKIIGGVETFRDVTERLALEEERDREKLMLEQVLNGIGDGVLTINEECMIDFANDRVSAVCGFKPEKMIGKPVSDFFEPGICAGLCDPAMQESISTSVRTRDNTECAVELRVLPFANEQGNNGRLLLFRPITPSERVKMHLRDHHNYRGVISNSPAMIEIFNLIESISDSDVTILIEGESGTGKEMIAHAIHEASPRANKPFNVVNCAVFNKNLLESELFGHGKGAFTGAISDKIGRFELADGGTIFLDEIGELPSDLQVKLLRFLQSREFERVGELKTRKVDVRIIAASNRDLLTQIEKGEFRDDLYYRLNVIPINLLPLRERIDDIPLLVEHFINLFCEKKNIPYVAITDDAMMLLKRHHWSGNVRELENAILHALTCCDGRKISVTNLPKNLRIGYHTPVAAEKDKNRKSTLEEEERTVILDALRRCSFSRSKAAEMLGVTRTTLWRKMKRYKLLS